MEQLRLGHRIVYDVAANWKLIIQNYSECLHCPGVHPALQRLSHFLSSENEPANPSYLGGWMDLREGIETLSMDGQRHRPCLPGLPAEEHRRVHYYAVLPNLLLSLHPDYVMTHTLWPRAVDRTEIVCEWHFHPDAMAEPGLQPRRRRGLLGPDEPPGLARLRADAARPPLPRLPPRPLLQPRRPPPRLRPAHPIGRKSGSFVAVNHWFNDH